MLCYAPGPTDFQLPVHGVRAAGLGRTSARAAGENGGADPDGWLIAGAIYGGVTRLAESRRPADGAAWRVFLSSTSELRNFPAGGKSYVAEVERAIAAAGHVIVDMADFPAADQPVAELCADRVRGCEVYVGVLGTRYGSPVTDRPEVSYTELEFEAATAAGLPRLVFLLDTDADSWYPARRVDRLGVRAPAGGVPPPGPGKWAGHAAVRRSGYAGATCRARAAGAGRASRGRRQGAAGAGPGGRGDRRDPAGTLGVSAACGPDGGAGRAGPRVTGTGGARAHRDARGWQDTAGRGLRPSQAGRALAAGGMDQRRGFGQRAHGTEPRRFGAGPSHGIRGCADLGSGGTEPTGSGRGAVLGGIRQRHRAGCAATVPAGRPGPLG